MKLKPIGERVVLKPFESKEEKTKSGLYLPKSSDDKKEGKIVAVGAFKDGKPIPLHEGDHIIYSGYSSEEYQISGQKYLIIEYKDIIAKIENPGEMQ